MLRTTTTICNYCRTSTPENVLADRMIRSLPENLSFAGRLKIVECSRCGLRYLNPTPDVRDLQYIYGYDVYEDSTNNNSVLMEHFFDKLRRHSPGLKSVLEVGCGTGNFLAWLQSKGLDVSGVEFAESANRVMYDGPLFVGRMEDIELQDASYDAVLLLNVIEHLSDPQMVLRKIRQALKPGGILLLRHPNSDLFFFRPYWLAVEVPKYFVHRMQATMGRRTRFTIAGFQNQHLFYFHREATTNLLNKVGFDVVDFSTSDPYNRLRISKSLARGNLLEAGIASLRHALGAVGLGPECLVVARSNRSECD
jgi:SAM-dependent methyltransferase